MWYKLWRLSRILKIKENVWLIKIDEILQIFIRIHKHWNWKFRKRTNKFEENIKNVKIIQFMD